MGATEVLRDIVLELNEDALIRQVGERQRSHQAFQSAAAWAVEQALELARPAGVYRWILTEKVEEGRLYLGGGVSLYIGDKADLLAPALEVLVSVATIGPQLEETVAKRFGRGEGLEGYLLDCAGVLALSSTRARFRTLIELEATRRGWGVSLSTAPGSLVGWPIQGQRELCGLLDLELIGVAVGSSAILSPVKSGSGLVGIGPDYPGSEGAERMSILSVAGNLLAQ